MRTDSEGVLTIHLDSELPRRDGAETYGVILESELL
jgi:hypothetical protein